MKRILFCIMFCITFQAFADEEVDKIVAEFYRLKKSSVEVVNLEGEKPLPKITIQQRPIHYTEMHEKLDATFTRTLGFCQGEDVVIDSMEWVDLDATEREMVLFHELGHCVLKRNHRDDTDKNGTPLSLMMAAHFNKNTYLKHKDYYMRELFNHE